MSREKRKKNRAAPSPPDEVLPAVWETVSRELTWGNWVPDGPFATVLGEFSLNFQRDCRENSAFALDISGRVLYTRPKWRDME